MKELLLPVEKLETAPRFQLRFVSERAADEQTTSVSATVHDSVFSGVNGSTSVSSVYMFVYL